MVGWTIKWMIRLMRQMLYKAMGNVHLTMAEIQEMMLYIEINMDNQLFTYLDNDIEQSILTPNVLLHRQIISVSDIQLEDDNPDIRSYSDISTNANKQHGDDGVMIPSKN